VRLLGLTTCVAVAGLVACKPRPADPLVAELQGALPERVEATGTVHEIDLRAAPAELALLDGRRLAVWAYNGQVPGPTIRVRVGDLLRVRFTNALPQPTTIHWHGIRLPNGMDGVPGVTQPPIAPGESFVYQFTPRDPGTFWFHPHLRGSEQVERGLFGLLIVEDRSPPPYSKELIWVLDDWLVGADGQIDPRFNTRHDLMHDGRWGNAITVNGVRRPAFDLRPGERVRLRMVNVANGRVFRPGLPPGSTLIAFDGLYLREPIPASGLELAPGNRADVDLTADAASSSEVLVRDEYTRRRDELAALRITGEPVSTPSFASPARAHVPRWEGALAREPTLTYRLNARAGGPFGIEWTLNDVASRPEDGHAHHAEERLAAARWAKIRFVNESARLHPMHLHGQFFKVIARGGRAVEEGFWRDTVLVQPKETVDVGLVPVDRGRWMLHCHIQEHAESGMMSLIRVD